MLWLALTLPRLPLDVFALAQPRSEPWAVVDASGRVDRVVACNDAARLAGIVPGMKRSAASALAGDLLVTRRRPDLEQMALEGLAVWAQQFTPSVALVAPDTLLLEIGGCIDYFHGLDSLYARVREGITAQGYGVNCGCAPTPLAACWLAQAGDEQAYTEVTQLEPALRHLPVALLPLPAERLQDLQLLGARTLGQLWGLPRKGLARRFGKGLPLLLDRALGITPDPREVFVPPDHFSKRLELAWAVDRTEALLFIGRQLSITLSGFLLGRGLGVQQVVYQLEHSNRTVTPLTIGYGVPTRQVDELVAVLREKLTHFELPAPVEAVTLIAERLHRLDGMPLDLFGDGNSQANAELLRARLVARLGDNALHQVSTVADHRPEMAWAMCSERRHGPDLPLGARPGWLLPCAQRLPLRQGRPWHTEALSCRGRPERLETGWWDGQRVVRDYWVAHGDSGRRYWIYQDRASGEWFLHGWFD
jgi:protein ImuB